MKSTSLPHDLTMISPDNTTSCADRKFWALREMQEILLLPSSIEDSRLLERKLLNDITGENLVITQILALPELGAIAAISPASPFLHLFVGRDLQHRAVIDLDNKIPLRMSANSDEIVLRYAAGEFSTIPITVLLTLREAHVQGVKRINSIAAQLKYAHIPDSLQDVSGFLPISSANGTRKLLAWRNNPLEIWTGEWGQSPLVMQPLRLLNKPSFLSEVAIIDACFLTESRSVFLADNMGSRILAMNPNEFEPRLRVIAGDGVCGDIVRFGGAQTSRLGRLHALCEFRIQAADADMLKNIIGIRESSETWLKADTSRQHRRTDGIKQGTAKLAEFLNRTPFLLALNLNSKKQPSVISVSLPHDTTPALSRLPDSNRRVLPLLPFSSGNANLLNALANENAMSFGLFQIPGVGFGIYQSGYSAIQILQSRFDSFRTPLMADKARFNELMRESARNTTTPMS